METIPLWPAGHVPGALGTDATDIPTLTLYPAPNPNGAAVVVCPGGGYGHLADHEGEPVARWLNTLGVWAGVMRYRLGPRYHHPAPHADASRALRTVRYRAQMWNVDPARVGILGFSAGGHLASSVSVYHDDGDGKASDPVDQHASRPNISVLLYPVIALDGPAAHTGSRRNLLGDTPDAALVERLSTDRHVTSQTPPTFLVHSADDKAVPVENSLRYASALSKAGVPFGLEIFEHGGHGFGMGKDDPVLTSWPAACVAWMRHRGFLGPTGVKP